MSKRYLFWTILIVLIHQIISQYSLAIQPQTHQKLSQSLQKLTQQLQYYKTPYQNKTNLYKRIALTQQYLQQINQQLSSTNNLIVGQSNLLNGQKNVLVGSYNTVLGSNNFIFLEKYQGQANGDLLIGKWRIQIQKKKLILINASLAISLINDGDTRKYLPYLTKSTNQRSYSVLKDSQMNAKINPVQLNSKVISNNILPTVQPSVIYPTQPTQTTQPKPILQNYQTNNVINSDYSMPSLFSSTWSTPVQSPYISTYINPTNSYTINNNLGINTNISPYIDPNTNSLSSRYLRVQS